MENRIPLTQGYETIVDAENYLCLNQWKWRLLDAGNDKLYAVRSLGKGDDGKYKNVLMHRVILGLDNPESCSILTDHINGDGLDNRRKNLRWATHKGNSCNRRRSRFLGDTYKGIRWHKGAQKWEAYITDNGKQIYLGLYSNPVHAAQAYNAAALELFGEFARLNLREERKMNSD